MLLSSLFLRPHKYIRKYWRQVRKNYHKNLSLYPWAFQFSSCSQGERRCQHLSPCPAPRSGRESSRQESEERKTGNLSLYLCLLCCAVGCENIIWLYSYRLDCDAIKR